MATTRSRTLSDSRAGAAGLLVLASLAMATGPAAAADPQFAPAQQVAESGTVGVGTLTELESADMNADGVADVVVTRSASPPVSVRFLVGMFLGDGRGGFKDGSLLFGPPVHTEDGRQIVLKDFNGDGRNDVFVADHGIDAAPFHGYQNTLALSTPDGRFADATANLPPASDTSRSATAADIDLDGDQDLYVGNVIGGDSPPYLLLNDGTGHFLRGEGRLPPAQVDRSQNEYTRSLFVNANGDAAPDLVLGAADGTLTSAVLINDGTGHFAALAGALPPKAFGLSGITTALVPIEINGDTTPDLVMGSTNGPARNGRELQLLIANGDGTYRDETSSRLADPPNPYASWPYAIRVGDLNADGRSDFAVSPSSAGMEQPALYLNDGGGAFRRHLPAEPRVGIFTFLDAGSDGRLDIFASSPIVDPFASYGGTTERHFVLRQLTDDDADGAEWAVDNCPDQSNPDQANLDGDALGDVCDPDDDGDAVADAGDACPTIARPAFNGCPAATLKKVGRLELTRRALRSGVRASCPAAGSGCTGRAVVRHRGRQIGTRGLALSAGRSAAVSVPLNRRGRRLVRDGRKRKLVVALEITGPDLRKVTLTRTGRVRLRAVAVSR